LQRKRNAPQPLELQRSRTGTMGVGRGLVALSAAAAAPLTHITSHNTALQLSMRSSSRASRQRADTRQACNNRRARTVQIFSSACAVPSHLPSTPSHAHTERSCTEHAGSEHASPDALRVAQQQRGSRSMPTQQETSRCTDRSHAARGADSTCCVGLDEVDRAYGHEHLEAELVAAGAAPRSCSGRCRSRSLALGGRAMRALFKHLAAIRPTLRPAGVLLFTVEALPMC